eukprot:gene35514-43785_t
MSIPGFKGALYPKGDKDYYLHQYQYGYSSQPERVEPAIVAYPYHDPKASTDNRRSPVLRASSTTGANIQLDLSQSFTGFDEHEPGSARLRVGISLALADFNAALHTKGYFVPHGQCSHVHVGGHCQTGGYGQLGRSFGLFGDHIQVVEFVNCEGKVQVLSRGAGTQDDKDLFYAILGGSPGNFGVITHLTLQVHKDGDHPLSRGLKYMSVYDKDILQKLLEVKAEMANDPDFPGDLDYCVTVLGSTLTMWVDNHGTDARFRKKHPDLFGGTDGEKWPQAIVVYVQWANTKGANQDPADLSFALKWMDNIHKIGKGGPLHICLTSLDTTKPTKMSDLTKEWIFTNVREYELPYEKRTYMTNSNSLVQDKWAEWATNRIHWAMTQSDLKLSVQIQNFGGKNSQFYQKGLNGQTSYSWRADSNICSVMDCFYKPGSKDRAINWQKNNDVSVGQADSVFCKEDRRVLWGSYGEFDMSKAHQFYHETDEKYAKLSAIRLKADPHGVFMANSFCVGYEPPGEGAKVVAAVVSAAGRLLGAAPVTAPPTTVPDNFDEHAMIAKLKARKPVAEFRSSINSAVKNIQAEIKSTGKRVRSDVKEVVSDVSKKAKSAVADVKADIKAVVKKGKGKGKK